MNIRNRLPPMLACLWLALAAIPLPAFSQDQNAAGSRSVFGTNSYMSDGALALMAGNYERGVELTRLGLNDILTPDERATLLSNLCAGYVGLKEFDVAVVYCNRSLEIDPNNWRALQNRGAAYSGLGQVARALTDIEQGLAINPDSEALKVTLAIVREQAKRTARTSAAGTSTSAAENVGR